MLFKKVSSKNYLGSISSNYLYFYNCRGIFIFIFILSHYCPLTSLKREIKYYFISRLIKVTLIKREISTSNHMAVRVIWDKSPEVF